MRTNSSNKTHGKQCDENKLDDRNLRQLGPT